MPIKYHNGSTSQSQSGPYQQSCHDRIIWILFLKIMDIHYRDNDTCDILVLNIISINNKLQLLYGPIL